MTKQIESATPTNVYEVIAQGAVDGGYIYAEESLGIFSTLEKAIEFAKSEPWPSNSHLEAIDRYAVFGRELDVAFPEKGKPVFTLGELVDPYDDGRPYYLKSEKFGVCIKFESVFDRSDYVNDPLTSKTFELAAADDVERFMFENDLVWDLPTTYHEGSLSGMTVTFSIPRNAAD